MSDQENLGVGEEVAAPSETEDSQQQEIQEDPAQRNFREFRQLAKEQQRQLKAYEDRIAQLENRLHAPTSPPEDEDDPEDIATLAKVDKRAARAAEKIVEERLKKALQQKNYQDMEERMRDKFSDYDEVSSYYDDVVKEDPALVAYFLNSQNPFMAAYKKIKESPTYQRDHQTVSPKAEKILKNTSKPMRANAAPKASDDEVARMSPQQVWELAQKYAQGG